MRLEDRAGCRFVLPPRTTNPRIGEARTYEVDPELSRYEKGSAFARAMLAGLGQIHVDGVARVYRMPEHVMVGESKLAKTFAWGGVYGASTSVEELETTFAEGIATVVTEQKSRAAGGPVFEVPLT